MFHVPERARDTQHPMLGTTAADGNNGAFHLDSPEPGWTLAVIASDGDGWEHASVHAYRVQRLEVVGLLGRGSKPGTKERTPTWKEMCFVKRTFWDAEDEVVQFHPKESEYVNCHPHTLHLWKPIGVVFPTPNPEMVGPATAVSAVDPVDGRVTG